MTRAVLTVLGLLVPILIGCSEPPRSDDLIPLEVGYTWVYEGDVPGETIADTVSASADFGNSTYYKVTGGLLGKLLRENDWIRSVGDNVLIYNAADGLEDTLFAGGIAVGRTWNRGYLGCMKRCADLPQVETPAGTFEEVFCFTNCFPGPAIDIFLLYEIAPRMGIVRSIAWGMRLKLADFSVANRPRLPFQPER